MAYDVSRYRAVLLDLDGTVFKEEHALPGAVELIRRYNETGRRYACLTNHTFSSVRIAQRLERMGIPIDPGHIYTAGDAAADWIIRRFGEGARVYNLATDSFQEALEGRVVWVGGPGERCDVVANAAPVSVHATPDRQRVALELLKRGATLLGMCADRIYPSARGLELGVGALTAMLAYAANVEPMFTGKPQGVFFHTLCERLGVKPEECVLVGDNLESDIAGARGVGMGSLLVLTGVTREGDLERVGEGARPDGVISGLGEVVG
jgi:4-nitrophenyl phosphatase